MNILTKQARKRLTVGIAALLASGCMFAGIIVNNTNSAWAGEYESCNGDLTACGDFYYQLADGTYLTAAGLKQFANDVSSNECKVVFDSNNAPSINKTDNDVCKKAYDSLIYNGNKGSRGKIYLHDDNGNSTVEFRMIGINHDDKADGSGKAGLTFQAVQIYNYPRTYVSSYTGSKWTGYPGQGINGIYCNNVTYGKKDPISCLGNDANVNFGGWRDSQLRKSLNMKYSDGIYGSIWSTLPQSLQDNVTPVKKIANNIGYGIYDSRGDSSTIDRIFLLSPQEAYGNVEKDGDSAKYEDYYAGSQYEFWKLNGVTVSSYSKLIMSTNSNNIDNGLSSGSYWWLRSPNSVSSITFAIVSYDGILSFSRASSGYGVVPAFSF